jgi:sulfide:quinone oxidoreductase
MARVLILGGGAPGLAAAEGLAEIARDGEQILVVGEHAEFRTGAATPWSSSAGAPSFDLAEALARKGIGFRVGARRLHPDQNQLELADGTRLEYDVALIATGPRPAFDEIEGLGPGGYTESFCCAESLFACAKAWERLLARPGPVLVGAAQGASCFGAAYESVLRIDAALRKQGVRDAAPITFVTPEASLGDFGVGGIGDSRARLRGAFESRRIAWIDAARIDKVEDGTMRVHRLDERGACVARYALRFQYAMIVPPFRGIAAVAGIDGLADDRGFLIVDECLRNPRYRNIYAAGVAVTGESMMQGGPRIPYVIDGMVEAVLRNIRDQLDGRKPAAHAVWSAAQIVDLGAPGVSLIADPHAALEPQHGVRSGEWAYMPRCALCDVGQTGRPVPLR